MENSGWLQGFLVTNYEWLSAVLWIATILLFVIQLYFYIFRYGRIASFRNRNVRSDAPPVAVSVIVPVFQADFHFLSDTLPEIFAQTHPTFEVVVVNVSTDEDFAEQLKLIKITHPDRFNFTRLKVDPLYPITTKMALNVGIKAARYEHLIFTRSDCRPRTNQWLEIISRGFSGSEVVLGYTTVSESHSLANRLIRCSVMATSARWLSEAMSGHPYRGTHCNMGFTKRIYFETRGFNYLNMDMGDDDLFIAKIARKENTAVIVNGSATVEQTAWGGFEWWNGYRRKSGFTHLFYPRRIKFLVGSELWSRALLMLLTVAALIFTPLYGKILAGSLLLLRLMVVMIEMRRICRRTFEHGLLLTYPLYDLFSPCYELFLAIVRRLTPRYKWK